MPLPLPSCRAISLLLCVLTLTACQRGQSQTDRPTPLPQDPQIQVYSNHNPAASYNEPYRQQTRDGDNLEQIIIDAIAGARSTVDVAVQELRLPNVAAALVARQQAGVKVRVILENTYSRPFSRFTATEVAQLPERERNRHTDARRLMDQNGNGQLEPTEINQRDALVMLDQARIPRIDDTADGSQGSNLMHHKFVVVDQQTVIVTSSNFTTSDAHGDLGTPSSRGNANNLLRISSPELAALFTQEFNLMWGDGPGGKPDSRFGTNKPFRAVQRLAIGANQVAVQFSPSRAAIPWNQTSNGLIGQTLGDAKQAIAMALFVFSDQQLVNGLEPLQQQGVEIRALIEPGFAYRSYSEGLDMMGIALAEDCKYEPENHPWRSPITSVGVPRLAPGDMLHHKFGVVDQQTVITGSHNWTTAADRGNDETLLIVHNPVVAAHFQREFERLYQDAILGVPPAIRKKAEAQSQKCLSSTEVVTGTIASQPVEINRGQNRDRASHPPSRSAGSHATPKLNTGLKKVNLNTATQAELESLPGVGPGLAKRIIATRQHQRFRSLSDLDQVSGVGPKLLSKLGNHVTW